MDVVMWMQLPGSKVMALALVAAEVLAMVLLAPDWLAAKCVMALVILSVVVTGSSMSAAMDVVGAGSMTYTERGKGGNGRLCYLLCRRSWWCRLG